ncbi:iron-containing alcohol dehydrogenase [Alicyclobacillus macrosporangiidus]|uniref:1,3-propanediol dehydrogenase n=1 Tax=Alicyclobacillus macrosporangiidus TaxID=392015 RepID=A0A1I7H0L0_9BACL|nr:iron-containing alcohol dehydrogenase [Alicyclobacillus macrosporangiidus]SFU54207.1 1,3-propanediol dehydrogenase [Alicyclobacillus macrosporangiidus]
MNPFATFRLPQVVHYGRDAFQKAGEEAAVRGKKALVVSDSVMEKLGNVARCQAILSDAGVSSVVYSRVDTEPTDTYVAEALAVLQEEGCDLLVAIGGGSCIDTAKAVAVVATNGGYIGDYMGGRKPIPHAPIPVIAIPTTAGTGSEVTDATVITNTAEDIKMMIKHPAFLPAVAVVDPLLTLSSPPSVTAATGVDALCHAIEAYISRRAQPMTDTLALTAIDDIVKHLRRAYQDGQDVEARERMAVAAMLAGAAFSNASVCLVHGMSRPIGAVFHVPHGVSNAMLLPAVLEYTLDAAVGRLAVIARIVNPTLADVSDRDAAVALVADVKRLCRELNIPNLRGWGIDKTAFDEVVAKMARDAIASGSPGNNPRVPTAEEIEALYQVAYDYDFSAEVKA